MDINNAIEAIFEWLCLRYRHGAAEAVDLDGEGLGPLGRATRWTCIASRWTYCYQVATRTPRSRRIQEDIELGRVAYFACA